MSPDADADVADVAEVVVVGAGIAGLAAARELAAAGLTPLVVDPNERPGGVMQTDSIDGYRVETGPNTFQAKPPLCAFATRHGLWPELLQAQPESRKRWILRGHRLIALPHGPGSAVSTSLLSARAKLRILAEPFVRRGDATGETVHEFVSRRLGAEVSSELVGAFLTGVYAGDERALGAEAVFPALVEWERSHGSLLRGALAGALSGAQARRRSDAAEPGRPGTWSGREGLGSFADALAKGLPVPVRTSTRVVALEREPGEGWRLSLSGPGGDESVRTPAVILAAPAWATAALLADVAPDASKGLREIAYAPIVAVALGVDPTAVRAKIEGFGLIVPRSSGGRLLGCLFMSRIFPGRAPEGRELLHCMLGGVRWPEVASQPDDVLRARLLEDLDRSLGLVGEPRSLCVRRFERAIPQPGTDHPRRIADVERRLATLRGLALAGSFVGGVSVADSLASGVRAASQVVEATA